MEVINVVLQDYQELVLILGGLGFMAYLIYQHLQENEVYQDKEPDEVTRRYVKRKMKNAEKVSKTLLDDHGDRTIKKGKVMYEQPDTMPEEVISPVIDPDADESELEPKVDVIMYKVRPENESLIKFILADVIFDKDLVSDYYCVRTDNLKEYDDEIVVKQGVNLDYDRGVYTDRTQSAKNMLNQIIRLESQTELVKGHMNFAGRVIYHDSAHARQSDIVEKSKPETDER